MTRTERSHSLRALLKDRSEARNGMDSSVPKGGAGGHNWGSLDQVHEITALVDEDADFEEGEATLSQKPEKPAPVRRMSSLTDEDRENAINVRKNAFKNKGGIDLVEIARSSSAVSGSPPKEGGVIKTSIF